VDLTERDRAILDFERAWWHETGPKESLIQERFELSATRYCPVNAMLAAGEVTIEHRYRLEPDDGEAVGAVVAIVGPKSRVEVVG